MEPMSGESFRFIHASDFHLETPLGEMDVLPPHLRDTLALAPRRAATAVFEAALVENIDFLVLSGDLLNPASAGPFGISLLLQYFDALSEMDTPVFWAAGSADDPQKWPEAAPLPDNVTLFPKGRVSSVPMVRSGQTICNVVGRSSDGRSQLHIPSFRIDPTDHFTIGVGYGEATPEALSEARFDYWALGGRHQRCHLEGGGTAGAGYSGSPQARRHEEAGPHGYTIVDIDSDQNARIHDVDCDAVRYETIKLSGAEIAAADDIRQLMANRIARLRHDNGNRALLLRWEISAGDAESISAVG
ncbi:MAG: metallophosphoesterase, partial [Planctomycetota bacterium]